MRTTASASTATSAAEFRLIADSLAHIVWTAAPDGSTEYFNRQAAIYCGSRTGVTSGWEWQSLVHPEDADEFAAHGIWRYAPKSRFFTTFESAGSTANTGGTRSAVCRCETSTGQCSSGSVRRLTSRLRNKSRAICERPSVRPRKRCGFRPSCSPAAGQAIVAVDLNRTVIYWNRAAEEIYGWSAAEAMGRHSTDLIVRDESPDQMRSDDRDVLRGETWSGDYEVTRRDGSQISVFVTNTPMLGSDGVLVAVIGSSIDITTREQRRRQVGG